MLALSAWAPRSAFAATTAPVTGEIQGITIVNAADHWSGGTIVVGGIIVTLPRNLLLDLPANRLTLQQLYQQAPAACRALGETGLAKTDTCNTGGMGGIATISANYTTNGNVIAGDVLIAKGVENIVGTITYIDYASGYVRLNGIAGDPKTGVMVRLNDPLGRHTIQAGPGCADGSRNNCSADPRFALDADNYTNTFSTGYPLCIPSTLPRPFPGLPGVPAGTAQAAADGTGDLLCPAENRASTPVKDSRRFAPLKLGDSFNAEGSFETVNGVRFLSAHTTRALTALTTSQMPGQPDYLFVEEAFIDAPGFQNQRARSLFIGFTTFAPADVMLWSIHYDPLKNEKHELPLGSTVGCDAAFGNGPGTCAAQGLAVNGADIFRIRHDVDFIFGFPGGGGKGGTGPNNRLAPCAHLVGDPRMPRTVCPSAAGGPGSIAENFAILSPIPHEVQFRTGRKFNSLQLGVPLRTLDVGGKEATNGQYLFPFGINLGGIDIPNAFEFNLNGVNTPFSFSGIPWNLDRRLSPGGCIDTTGDGIVDCEATPQPLDPFPFEVIDPRTQATAMPTVMYDDQTFTASPLTSVSDRILSFVSGGPIGTFDGDSTVLAWPPVDPAPRSIAPTPALALVCTAGPSSPTNRPPIAVADVAVTLAITPVVVDVLANDSDPDSNPIRVTAVTNGAGGAVAINGGATVTYTPNAGFTGADAFSYDISDGQGGTASAAVNVTVSAVVNEAPVAVPDVATTPFNKAVTIPVLANDSDVNGDLLSVSALTQPAGGAAVGVVTTNGTTLSFDPNNSAFSGTTTFTYTVSDGHGLSAVGLVTITVRPAETLTVTLAQFTASKNEWRISGTSTVNGSTVTIHAGPTLAGAVIGAAPVVAGAWTFRGTPNPSVPSNPRVSISSSGGATRLNQVVVVR